MRVKRKLVGILFLTGRDTNDAIADKLLSLVPKLV